MTDADLKRQLEELRREVERLGARSTETTTNKAAPSDVSELLSGVERLAKSVDTRALGSRVGELLGELASDVKKSEPRALVASFLAGVAVGRLLSR